MNCHITSLGPLPKLYGSDGGNGGGTRGLRGEGGVITTSKEMLKNQDQKNLPMYLGFPLLWQKLPPSSRLQKKKKSQGLNLPHRFKQENT